MGATKSSQVLSKYRDDNQWGGTWNKQAYTRRPIWSNKLSLPKWRRPAITDPDWQSETTNNSEKGWLRTAREHAAESSMLQHHRDPQSQGQPPPTYTHTPIYIYVCVCVYIYIDINIYRVSQEECARLREGVPHVKVYRYNPKHLSPKLNGYGHNGQRKVWSSCGSTHCTWQLPILSISVLQCGVIWWEFSSR